MPTALDTSSASRAGHDPAEGLADRDRDLSGLRRTPARSPRRAVALEERLRHEPDAVAIVDLLAPRRAERQLRAVAHDGEGDRPALARRGSRRRSPGTARSRLRPRRRSRRPGAGRSLAAGDPPEHRRRRRAWPRRRRRARTRLRAWPRRRRGSRPGPAKITATRFHAGRASRHRRERRVVDVGEALVGALARPPPTACPLDRGPQRPGAPPWAASWSPRSSAVRTGAGAASSHGASSRRPRQCRVEVARRGAMHPRDLHVAAERDRADAVLDPVLTVS